MNKIELLSPAGDMERLNCALMYGADAVYLAGKEFGMRTASANFDFDELKKAVECAHEKGVKVYLTCNTLPRNEEISKLPEMIKTWVKCDIDAFIVTDLGVLSLVKKYAPDTEVHFSTQTGMVNYLAATEAYNMGAARIVVARELSLNEIKVIRDKTPPKLMIEAFVHGAMCMSYSGRCLISSYLTGRDANRGDCVQPCRWKYHLMEETRPGIYFKVFEDDLGTHIMNAKDLCMIEHVSELFEAGISSFKIEGRAKSAYYTAATTYAYRQAIDFYYSNPKEKLPLWIKEEANKVSHREYSTGFYFGQPNQVVSYGGYERDYSVVAIVTGYEKGRLILSQRGKFFSGDELDVMPPNAKSFLINAEDLRDEKGNLIESAPHAMMTVSIKFDRPLPIGTYFRKANET